MIVTWPTSTSTKQPKQKPRRPRQRRRRAQQLQNATTTVTKPTVITAYNTESICVGVPRLWRSSWSPCSKKIHKARAINPKPKKMKRMFKNRTSQRTYFLFMTRASFPLEHVSWKGRHVCSRRCCESAILQWLTLVASVVSCCATDNARQMLNPTWATSLVLTFSRVRRRRSDLCNL